MIRKASKTFGPRELKAAEKGGKTRRAISLVDVGHLINSTLLKDWRGHPYISDVRYKLFDPVQVIEECRNKLNTITEEKAGASKEELKKLVLIGTELINNQQIGCVFFFKNLV